jgi:hypothetical protein
MTSSSASPAVATALAHCQAWSTQDWDTARAMLADDVNVTATSTLPIMPATNLTGADAYMQGLKQFAAPIVPGSLQINATAGDARNALVMLTVQAPYGPNGATVDLPGARLYLLDDQGKIKVEQVVFYVAG